MIVALCVYDKRGSSIAAAAVFMILAVITETNCQSSDHYFMQESRVRHRETHCCTPRGNGRERERIVNRKELASAPKSSRTLWLDALEEKTDHRTLAKHGSVMKEKEKMRSGRLGNTTATVVSSRRFVPLNCGALLQQLSLTIVVSITPSVVNHKYFSSS